MNHKSIGFLSNSGSDPHTKITKLPSKRSMFGHHRPAGETPFNWCFAGVIWCFAGSPLIALFGSSLPSLEFKKNVVRDGPLWQNLLDPHMLWI